MLEKFAQKIDVLLKWCSSASWLMVAAMVVMDCNFCVVCLTINMMSQTVENLLNRLA